MTQLDALRAAGRTPPVPYELATDDGQALRVTHWLRVLPGKRLVGMAEIQGRTVLAKLFIAPAAERHHSRELQGIEALQAAQLRAPQVLASGSLGGGGFFLLTEFLQGAKSLAELWDSLDDCSPASEPATRLLGRALATVGSMHLAGLQQKDLHLGNFLQLAEHIYIIDGDAVQVQRQNQPLSSDEAHTNLAIFFAQLKPEWDVAMDLLLVDYLGANFQQVINPVSLASQIRQVRQRRMDDYLAKTLRDCTGFAVTQRWSRYSVVRREDQSSLAGLLAEPDSAFKTQLLLKDGGSSTVARANHAGGDLVVKRYNIKGIGHWLSRMWRPSRAWHSWLAAHRLQFLGIATPPPVAMVERRFGPLRHSAWLVTEYQAGPHLLELLGDGTQLPPQETLDEIRNLFVQLADAKISHGDCKATNLLWHDGKIYLIDLDAMQVWSSSERWAAAWARDRSRFLRNWNKDSALHQWLDKHLPARDYWLAG